MSDVSALKTYKGGCHCGKIQYEVEGDIQEVIDCNCSLCQKRGGLLWFTSGEHFKLLTPVSDVGTYTFNKHYIQHHFCGSCGIAPYSEGKKPDGSSAVAINVRCLENIDLAALKRKHVNGRDF